MLASRRAALIVAALAVLGASTSVIVGTPAVVRAGLSAPLVLLLPGLAWMSLLRPAGLDLATRLVLSVACSVMLAMLAGLLLNWTPWGLTPHAWALSLSMLTLAPTLLRLRLVDDTPGPAFAIPARALLLVFPAAAAIFGLVMAYDLALQSAVARRDAGFTQLWLIGDEGSCAGTIRIGLNSFEREPVGLRLTLLVDHEYVTDWYWPASAPGQRWETTLASGWSRASYIDAQLTRDDQPGTVYRWARLDCGDHAASVGGSNA